MSHPAELSQRFNRLQEISGIMTAMKNLSLVETRKLARFIPQQQRLLANIEAATADFLHFHPWPQPTSDERHLLILIGSERGFCGGFNDCILEALEAQAAWPNPSQWIVVGQRLIARLGDRAEILARLDGATVTEDVPAVLGRLMDALQEASRTPFANRVALYALAHKADGEVPLSCLLPLSPRIAPPFTQAPCLQIPPAELLAQLLDQYLLAALQSLLYASLAAENRQRLAHMENALDRLDETLATLALKRNALRQEKIIGEIEIMLSSQEAFAGGLDGD